MCFSGHLSWVALAASCTFISLKAQYTHPILDQVSQLQLSATFLSFSPWPVLWPRIVIDSQLKEEAE